MKESELMIGNFYWHKKSDTMVILSGYTKSFDDEVKVRIENKDGYFWKPLNELYGYPLYSNKHFESVGLLYKKEGFFTCEKWILRNISVEIGISCYIVFYRGKRLREVSYIHELQNIVNSLNWSWLD